MRDTDICGIHSYVELHFLGRLLPFQEVAAFAAADI
jgi:hypothetical protein